MLEIAGEPNATAQQVGTAWLPAHSPNALLVSGTSKLNHLKENIAAGDIVFSDEQLARLEAVTPEVAPA